MTDFNLMKLLPLPRFHYTKKTAFFQAYPNQCSEARERVLNERDNDDPSGEDIAGADLQTGMDRDFYEVEKVNISGKSEDDTIELSDGTKIDVSD